MDISLTIPRRRVDRAMSDLPPHRHRPPSVNIGKRRNGFVRKLRVSPSISVVSVRSKRNVTGSNRYGVITPETFEAFNVDCHNIKVSQTNLIRSLKQTIKRAKRWQYTEGSHCGGSGSQHGRGYQIRIRANLLRYSSSQDVCVRGGGGYVFTVRGITS